MKSVLFSTTHSATASASRSPRVARQAALFSSAVMLGLGVFASQASATDYYWRSTDTASTWNTSSKWFTSPSGGLQSPGMSALDTYHITNVGVNVTNTGTFTNNGTTDTFLGGTLVLGTAGQLNVRTSGSSSAYVENFRATGGGLIVSTPTNNATHNLVINSFVNESGVTRLSASSSGTDRRLSLSIGTLTGSGGFAIDAGSDNARSIFISVTNATAYTGTFDFDRGTINFNNDLVSGGSLILSGSVVVTLDQSISFTSVVIDGAPLIAGFHSFADLNLAFDSFFTDGGSGGITVTGVPEPASFATVAGAALLGFAGSSRRRRD